MGYGRREKRKSLEVQGGKMRGHKFGGFYKKTLTPPPTFGKVGGLPSPGWGEGRMRRGARSGKFFFYHSLSCKTRGLGCEAHKRWKDKHDTAARAKYFSEFGKGGDIEQGEFVRQGL